jgi:hypothetical protein
MRLIVVFCLSVIFYSCHSRVPVRLSRFDSIASIDTTCKQEVNLANADFLKGKLTYCHFIGMLTPSFRNETEFIAALRKYNISYRTESVSDDITDQTQGCYCDFMRDRISDHYGNHFIDSLLNVSDCIYLAKHINDTISCTLCDVWPRYPGDSESNRNEESRTFQKQCDSRIKYPSGYTKKADPNKSAFVNICFIITKTG